MQIGYKTDIGKVRERNEDNVLVDRKINLFIVADGMGSKSGDIASQMTASVIDKFLKKKLIKNRKIEILHIIKSAIQKANDEIAFRQAKDEKFSAASTVVLALKHSRKVYIANIGDSRAYLIRNKRIKQLSEDHSYVAWLVKKRKITKAQAKTHPLRNVVTNLVGNPIDVMPHLTLISWKKNDYLLLCSDGLTKHIGDEEIKRIILQKKTPQKACNELIQAAIEKGGKDNISVIVILFDKEM
ncbi:MAG: Stp1/IreP family PP2C-type Ser/Thr phosphatase [candidate division WOR-3 bacterium]